MERRVNTLKSVVKRIPLVGTAARALRVTYKKAVFPGSQAYWEQNYARGGNSGAGSYGEQADFKAEVLNQFVQTHNIQSVIEFGSGDGNQLSLANYPKYIGLDVSKTAIQLCMNRFDGDATKSFYFYDPDHFVDNARLFHADLAISLEVIFHLIEDVVFDQYMRYLFAAADRYVIVFSSNTDQTSYLEAAHYKNRRFSVWVENHCPNWTLNEVIPNRYPFDEKTRAGSTSDFYIYAKR